MNPVAFVIEDDPRLGTIYEAVLQQTGYETEIIRNGDEALIRLATACPDLILLDLHLPYVSGKAILQFIGTSNRLAQTPVIVLTADIYAAKALEEQGHRVLIKSQGISELRAAAVHLRPAGS